MSSSSSSSSSPYVFTATLCSCGFPVGIIAADFAERLARESDAKDPVDHQRNIDVYRRQSKTNPAANALLRQYGLRKSCCIQRVLCAFCLPSVS